MYEHEDAYLTNEGFRIAKQVKLETVVDRAAFELGQWKSEGGFTRLNKVFEGTLETVLGDLADEVWKDAG